MRPRTRCAWTARRSAGDVVVGLAFEIRLDGSMYYLRDSLADHGAREAREAGDPIAMVPAEHESHGVFTPRRSRGWRRMEEYHRYRAARVAGVFSLPRNHDRGSRSRNGMNAQLQKPLPDPQSIPRSMAARRVVHVFRIACIA